MEEGIFAVIYDDQKGVWVSRNIYSTSSEYTAERIIYSGASTRLKVPRLSKDYVYIVFQSADINTPTRMLKGTLADKACDHWLKSRPAVCDAAVYHYWGLAGQERLAPTAALPYFGSNFDIRNFVVCEHRQCPRVGTLSDAEAYYEHKRKVKEEVKAYADQLKTSPVHMQPAEATPCVPAEPAQSAEKATVEPAAAKYIFMFHFEQDWVPVTTGVAFADVALGDSIYRILYFPQAVKSKLDFVRMVIEGQAEILRDIPASDHAEVLAHIVDKIYTEYTVTGA